MSLYLTFNAFSRRIQPRLPREREMDRYIYIRAYNNRAGEDDKYGGWGKERKRREKKTLILPLKGIASRNNEDATFDWLPFRVASIADCSDCSLAHARDCALSSPLCVHVRAREGKSSWREGG